jgi:hypothetical protein
MKARELSKKLHVDDTPDGLTLLEYEVRGSWWVRFVHWEFAQRLAAQYLAWKTRRKYERYKMFKLLEHQGY